MSNEEPAVTPREWCAATRSRGTVTKLQFLHGHPTFEEQLTCCRCHEVIATDDPCMAVVGSDPVRYICMTCADELAGYAIGDEWARGKR